jgi:hypothetical protein
MDVKDIEGHQSVSHKEFAQLPERLAKHIEQGDKETAHFAASPSVEIDAATNKRVFWMVNRRVLVIMLITYFCQSLDKGTLNFASIMNIQKDAHLVGQQVSFHMYAYRTS